jgi:hypothetical protein
MTLARLLGDIIFLRLGNGRRSTGGRIHETNFRAELLARLRIPFAGLNQWEIAIFTTPSSSPQRFPPGLHGGHRFLTVNNSHLGLRKNVF